MNKVFGIVDRDKNGTISLLELLEALELMGFELNETEKSNFVLKMQKKKININFFVFENLAFFVDNRLIYGTDETYFRSTKQIENFFEIEEK